MKEARERGREKGYGRGSGRKKGRERESQPAASQPASKHLNSLEDPTLCHTAGYYAAVWAWTILRNAQVPSQFACASHGGSISAGQMFKDESYSSNMQANYFNSCSTKIQWYILSVKTGYVKAIDRLN